MARLTLLGGSLLHIGTNTSNDYFDHKSGTDKLNYNYSNKGLNGGSRGIQMGLISPKGMLNLSIITFALSAVVGIPLIQKGWNTDSLAWCYWFLIRIILYCASISFFIKKRNG